MTRSEHQDRPRFIKLRLVRRTGSAISMISASVTRSRQPGGHGGSVLLTVGTRCVGDVILARTAEELVELAAVDGQPAYRGKQLMDGVLHGARSVDDIRNVRICLMPAEILAGFLA